MPKDFIKVDTTVTTAKFAPLLTALVHDVRELLDLAEQIKGIMDHNVSGADYADIETLFGLPVGNGDEVYNLVSGALAAIKGVSQSADALTLIDRVG